MRKYVADILAGAGFLALAAAFGAQLGDLEGISRVFPQSLIILVALGGVYFILKGLFQGRRERKAAPAENTGPAAGSERVSWPRIGLITVLAVIYAFCLKPVGFFASIGAFLFLAFMLLSDGTLPPLRKIIYGLLFTGLFCLSIWLGFVQLLNVPTPVGIFI